MISPIDGKQFCACFFALILIMLICSSLARADASFIPPEPKRVENVEFYLITRGPGKEAYTKYGHTMIRMVDPSHNLDVNYNWGAFSFEEPGFILKFLRGFLTYHLDISPSSYDIKVSNYEKRWLRQERLNLTAKQKISLLAVLYREAQPACRYYRYLFFTDNCATRPRNFLDEALGDKIAARFKKDDSGETFRDKVMKYNASSPVLAMGQDVLLNSEADQRLSKWEEMFVPFKLRDYLLTMLAYNDDGSAREGEKLLSDTTTLAAFPEPAVPWYNGYMIFWAMIGIPMLLGMILAPKRSFRKAGIRIFGLSLFAWGAVSGIFATFLAFSWAFSEHTVLAHNANLWLFWPLDWLYLLLGASFMVKGSIPGQGGFFSRLTNLLTLGHLAALGVYALLAMGGFFSQYVIRVLIYYGSLSLLLYGFTLYLSGLSRRTAATRLFS